MADNILVLTRRFSEPQQDRRARALVGRICLSVQFAYDDMPRDTVIGAAFHGQVERREQGHGNTDDSALVPLCFRDGR